MTARLRYAAAGVVMALLAGCSSTAVSGPQAAGATPAGGATPVATSHAPADYTGGISTREVSPEGLLTDFYVEGQAATLRLPQPQGPTPLVVVVPGGGWQQSDPTDYQPLAEFLTAAGMTTSLITYDGAQFPKPIDDVACAIRWSAFQVNALGYPAAEVYVVGHSAGGHLAVETAITGDRFGSACPWPPVTVTGVAGLAGAYDLVPISTLPDGSLFAGGGTPEERSEFSPITAVNDPDNPIPPSLKVLLLSGASDVVVPAVQPEELTAALRARGIEPTATVLPLEHTMGFPLAHEIAPIIAAWVLGDTYTPSPTPTPVEPGASASPTPATAAPVPGSPAG